MCGIAGFFAKEPIVPASVLEAMTEAIRHRGPDDGGHFGVGPGGAQRQWKDAGSSPGDLQVGIGVRRLAILDLSPNAAQPMATRDGRFTLGFNGQIYNFTELKEGLGDEPFRSSGDTEVLLRMLAAKGTGALPELDGMFAFALFDREHRELLLARDPLGIKPLYWMEDERGVFFGSEIRTLLAASRTKPAVEKRLLARYLLNNWIPDPDTLFQGIHRLEAGHYLLLRQGSVVEDRAWWDLELSEENDRSPDDWAEALDQAITTSVRRQLRSDVPLAFFLSGGVDSSLLAVRAIGAGVRPSTYTIGFRWKRGEPEGEDLLAARELALHQPFDSKEIILAPDIVSLLPKVVSVLEEPVADAAAICSYLICEAASEEHTVLVSGLGADELFGGYPVLQAGWLAYGMQTLPRGMTSWLKAAADKFPYTVGGRSLQAVHRARKILGALEPTWPEPFCLLRSPMTPAEADALLVEELRKPQLPPFGRQLELHAHARFKNPFDQMMYLDAKTYLPANNLAYADKTSMAHSVELRVPFLGRDVIDIARRIPARLKIDGLEGKVMLKAVARKYLPKGIVNRRKAGFGLPLRDWFVGDLQKPAKELLSPQTLQRQGLFNPELPQRWLAEHARREADHGTKLYALMTLQLWLESISGPAPSSSS